MGHSKTSGPLAVLLLPKQDKDMLKYSKKVLGCWQGNAQLPSPPIPLTQFQNDINAYDQAETEAGTRAEGAAENRDSKRLKVVEDMKHLRDYLQSVVETMTSAAAAIALIVAAGFAVRKVGKRNKAVLAVAYGDTSGTVLVEAKALGPRTTYYWAWSLDMKTWTSVPETMRANTVISGLTPGQTYYFRFRALTPSRSYDWSQAVSLMVR